MLSISKHRSTCHAKNREKIPKPQKRKNRQNSLTFSDISKDGCCTEWCWCVCNSFCGCIVGSNCRGWTGGGVGGGEDLMQTSSSSCSSVFSTLNSVIGMPCVFAKISNSYSGEEKNWIMAMENIIFIANVTRCCCLVDLWCWSGARQINLMNKFTKQLVRGPFGS